MTVGVGNAEFTFKPEVRGGGGGAHAGHAKDSADARFGHRNIDFGEGWTQGKKRGHWKHRNGAVAEVRDTTQIRFAPGAQFERVVTQFGKGFKLPSGVVIGVDKDFKPYQIGPGGQRMPLPLGTSQDGMVRVFETTSVRVVQKDGTVHGWDSLQNHRMGKLEKVVRGGGPAAGSVSGAKSANGTAPPKGGPPSLPPGTPKPPTSGGPVQQKPPGPGGPGQTPPEAGPPSAVTPPTGKDVPAAGGPKDTSPAGGAAKPDAASGGPDAVDAHIEQLVAEAMELVRQLIGALETGETDEDELGDDGLGLTGMLAGVGTSLTGALALATPKAGTSPAATDAAPAAAPVAHTH